MDVAERFAKLSSAKRLQVGAIIVKEDRIISIGYNGMPAGWTNECEYEDVIYINGTPMMDIPENRELITKPEVIHAEANAIAKLAKSSESGKYSTMFLTHAPCLECAKQIYTAGIRNVFYRNQYRSTDGVEFLKKCNIEVEQA
jgi:dCMP deaminase